MSWIRLDDGYSENAKISDLSDLAFRADIEGMLLSSRSKRDGHVPGTIALRLWGKGPIGELVAVGRWHEGRGCGTADCITGPGDGFVIHDFLFYNPTDAERSARSDAGRNAARIRWSNAESDALAHAGIYGEGGSRSRSSKNKDSIETDEFIEFYEHTYPRRQGRGAARKAWNAAIRKAQPLEIIAGAQRFADDPNREPAYTPHPSTWLNQERWADDPLPRRNGRVRGSQQNLLDLADRVEKKR